MGPGKELATQAGRPEFNPRTAHKGRRGGELTPQS